MYSSYQSCDWESSHVTGNESLVNCLRGGAERRPQVGAGRTVLVVSMPTTAPASDQERRAADRLPTRL
jgi:hypothetical protein